MSQGTRETRRIYTGLGLWRVKPYVQVLVFVLQMKVQVVLGRTPLLALYWLTDKVDGPRVQVGYNMETYLKCQLQHYPVIFGLSSGAVDIFTSCLACQVSYRIRSLRRICRKIFGATNQVCWPHCQVSESSDGPDPLVGDDREPSWWGTRGTIVSHIALVWSKRLKQKSLCVDDKLLLEAT
jgi:hypothetical protein